MFILQSKNIYNYNVQPNFRKRLSPFFTVLMAYCSFLWASELFVRDVVGSAHTVDLYMTPPPHNLYSDRIQY